MALCEYVLILVTNTNCLASLRRHGGLLGHIFTLDSRVPPLTHLFGVKTLEYHILQSLESLGYVLVADSIGLDSASMMWLALKPTAFGEKHHKMAVQGHSRSPILVPMESSYTTCY